MLSGNIYIRIFELEHACCHALKRRLPVRPHLLDLLRVSKLGLVCCTATWLLTRPFHRNKHLYTCFAVTLCDSHRPVWRCLADRKLVFQPLAPQFFVAPVPVQNAYWNLNCPACALTA
jgi:hypothetical protein